ncbi:MAG: alpha/beta hydrolase [Chloroflexi bacterium]|nr:alpha/beta hydrolase [Chloroflexota bacterium]MBV9598868.1 alpha/beta hydrolase [Chloroflexota bacterium]
MTDTGSDLTEAPPRSGELAGFRELQARVLERFGSPARSRMLRIADPPIDAHVLDAGTGEPVLLLHGGMGYAVNWEPLLDLLAAECRVVAPDRPSCGLSDLYDVSNVDVLDYAPAFVGSVLDALAWPSASLMGNSQGGFWSILFALAHPERVRKLILIGAPAGIDPLPPHLAPSRSGTPPPPAPPRSRRERIERTLVVNGSRVGDDLVAVNAAGDALSGAAEAGRTYIGSFIRNGEINPRYNLRPRLAEISVPTLFIWGTEDRYAPPSSGHAAAATMPNARVVEVPQAGHLAWWDQPETCAAATLEFLRR